MTNYAAVTNRYARSPELAGRFRLILGLTMMIAGLYVGLFTEMPGHGLGLLCFIVSPFVFLTDRKPVVRSIKKIVFQFLRAGAKVK